MKKDEFIKQVKVKSATHLPTQSPKRSLEDSPWKPTVDLTSSELPCLKEKKVGDKVYFEVEGKVISKREGDKNTVEVQKVGENEKENK